MRRTDPQAGFTLLELLIAVVVLAIVMAIIYESYFVCSRAVAAAQEQSDLYQSARLALRRMSDDLMGTYVPLAEQAEAEEAPPEEATGEGAEAAKGAAGGSPSGFVATDVGSGPGAQDTIDFVTTANLSRGQAGYEDYCQLNYDASGGTLQRTSTTASGEPETFELASNVKGLDFAFFSADGEESEDWNSSGRGLPAVVQITLYMGTEEDPELAVAFTTAVNIPLAWERDALGQGVAVLAAQEKAKAKEKAASGAAAAGEEGAAAGEGTSSGGDGTSGGGDGGDDEDW